MRGGGGARTDHVTCPGIQWPAAVPCCCCYCGRPGWPRARIALSPAVGSSSLAAGDETRRAGSGRITTERRCRKSARQRYRESRTSGTVAHGSSNCADDFEVRVTVSSVR